MWTDNFLVHVLTERSGGGVNQPDTSQEDQDSADSLYDQGPFGFFVPVHIPLNHFGKRAGKHDYGTMADAVNQEQQNPLYQIGGSQFEGHTQHGSHISKGTGTEGNSENQTQNECGQHPFPLHADLSRP